MSYKHRDIEFINLTQDEYLVTACDSCGGIGLKENDIVKAPNTIVGGYTARVCLMEILSVGATPMGITVNICNEPEPTGSEIVKGIKEELRTINMSLPMTISTEKNIKTSMTALGITVYGKIKMSEVLLNKVQAGDCIYTIGIPSVGNEVFINADKICTNNDILEYLSNDKVSEIIPVGSSGIKGELDKFQRETGLRVAYEDGIDIDIEKSAGPCTAAIIITKEKLMINSSKVNCIGSIY